MVVLSPEDRLITTAPTTVHRLSSPWRQSLLLVAALLSLLPLACTDSKPFVVVYTSQDQEYAEPIFKDFSRQSGINVRAIYDNEAIKTIGLVNRLQAEKNHPQCDLFWNNEALRTRQLARQNIFQTGQMAQFGFRLRRAVLHRSPGIPSPPAPVSLLDLTNAHWKGKIALAYPLFGTTATHFLALRQLWGKDPWLQWCRALAQNQPYLVDGNSSVVKLVAAGQASLGLTDSDDVAAGLREGLPILDLPLVPEFRIPNSLAVLRQAPHPREASALFAYLQSSAVSDRLASAHALFPSEPQPLLPSADGIDWDPLVSDMDIAMQQLKEVFLR